MKTIIALVCFVALSACTTTNYEKSMPVSKESVTPGSKITVKGKSVDLYPAKIALKVGDDFVAKTKQAGFAFNFTNQVTIINLVPSIDTPVCEAQNHILGESKIVKPTVKLMTISRDLPMAQKRFAKEAKLTNISYYSDYKKGTFGRSFGLMMKERELLARGVIVLDSKGKVRHMQLVPEATTLPDMNKAIKLANELN